jgi:hypothetical protein
MEANPTYRYENLVSGKTAVGLYYVDFYMYEKRYHLRIKEKK